MTTADLVVDARCLLGEGPTWDATANRLLWVDIEAGHVHELDANGRHSATQLATPSSLVVPDSNGELVGTAGTNVITIHPPSDNDTTIAELPAAGDGRTNDGRCDPAGRLWVGTVDRSDERQAGLFCIDGGNDGAVTKVRSGIGLSNGIDWSPDGSRCYYVDSVDRRIDEIMLDEHGHPAHARPLADTPFLPDGLTVDADGGIWVAAWDGGAVHRYTPTGQHDRSVVVPGGFVTSCAFGGPDLATLYITTARIDLPAHALADAPHAGGLFAADVGIGGRGYTPFRRPPRRTEPTTPTERETERSDEH